MEEAPSSPKSPLKFLCSHGGRILPRPSDGVLRYVGGENRVLSVPRSVSFAALKEKIAGMFNGESVVKYQLMAEDMDALVSVKTDEDLYHMIDEYDRLERRPRSPTCATSPRFRLYLFPYPAPRDPSVPVEQRYVDAINNGLPVPELAQHRRPRQLFTISSAGTSPTSTIDSQSVSTAAGCGGPLRPHDVCGGGMHRVRSTPNLAGGGGGSPSACLRMNAAGYCGGGTGWGIGGGGGFHHEVGYVSGCRCGCVGSSSQAVRKCVCSPPATVGSPLGSLTEVSPPRRGSQGFHFGPHVPLRRPPYIRGWWE